MSSTSPFFDARTVTFSGWLASLLLRRYVDPAPAGEPGTALRLEKFI